MPKISIVRPALVCLLACLTGCASLGALNLSREEFPKSGPKNPVVRIVGIWQAADGVSGNHASRGFSGQILFFASDTKLPAQVDGEVLVYVFDDQGSAEEQIKPIHEFKYPADTWNAFLGRGPLGATYNVFIPYTRTGLHQANCTLRLRYTPKQGPTIYSDMVQVLLPGVTKKPALEVEKNGGATEAAGAVLTPEVTRRQPPAKPSDSISLDTAREAAKPHSAELTEEDSQRLIEAAKARLKAERKQKIELTAFEEPAGDKGPESASGWKRRRPNVLLDDDEGAAESQETDASTGTSVQKRSPKGHLLDDESDDGEVEFLNRPTHAMDEGVE